MPEVEVALGMICFGHLSDIAWLQYRFADSLHNIETGRVFDELLHYDFEVRLKVQGED